MKKINKTEKTILEHLEKSWELFLKEDDYDTLNLDTVLLDDLNSSRHFNVQAIKRASWVLGYLLSRYRYFSQVEAIAVEREREEREKETLQEQEERSLKRIVEIAKANHKENEYPDYSWEEEKEIETLCKRLIERTGSKRHLERFFARANEVPDTDCFLLVACSHMIEDFPGTLVDFRRSTKQKKRK